MSYNLLLKTQLERLINKLLPQIYTYGTSSTLKNVLDKEVVLNNFILKSGAKIFVKFTDTSVTNPSSGNFSLNVNSTGAKSMILANSNTACSYEYADDFYNNKVQQFVYDGLNWVYIKDNSEGGSPADFLVTTNEFEHLD